VDERGALAGGMRSPGATWRGAMLGLAFVSWLAGLAILQRLGTWTPLALMGPALAALAIGRDAATRALLRPSFRKAAGGLAAGVLMVL